MKTLKTSNKESNNISLDFNIDQIKRPTPITITNRLQKTINIKEYGFTSVK